MKKHYRKPKLINKGTIRSITSGKGNDFRDENPGQGAGGGRPSGEVFK